MSEFKAWFMREREKGLADLKISVSGSPSAQQVKDAILDAESAIQEGRFRAPPTPDTSGSLFGTRQGQLISVSLCDPSSQFNEAVTAS